MKKKSESNFTLRVKPKVKRKGIHSKKNKKKAYRGQGK